VKPHLNYRSLIAEFIRNDIRLKYRNSALGILWSMLDPLLNMIVLTFIFSNLFRRTIPNFPVYCLTGRLLYSFFSSASRQCMKSITSNNGIIRKIYVPKFIFPLSTCLSSFIIFLLSLIPLLGLMMATGVPFKPMTLLAVYPLLMLLIISYGVGLFIASFYVFFRDIEHIYSVVLLLVMYTSAIFYSSDIVPERLRYLLHLNPIYSVINVFRDCLLRHSFDAANSWYICVIYAVVLLALGLFTFQKAQHRFIYTL
jgi:ABC-2 type transport system permease protein/lipopolysaccharide transport system permease protein